jgi:predicted SAM-dependent methyltransferase
MNELKAKKLNLGCGFDHKPGYVNVDLNERHNPDVVANAIDLPTFPPSRYEEIIAQDVLEHVVREDVRKALFEWNRLLVIGGRIFIRTTELGGLLRMLESPANQAIADQERLVQNLFGTQAYTGDFHLTGFTENTFRFYMWEAGFEIETLGLLHGAFLDSWARKVRDISFQHLIDRAAGNEAFVRSAYQDILGRPPRTDEQAADLNSLMNNAQGRLNVIRKLLLSDERKQRMIAQAPPFPKTLHVQSADQPTLLRRVARKCKRMVKSVLPINTKRSA